MLWTDWKTFCHLKPRNRFIAHLYCRILTIVTKSGTTAEKETAKIENVYKRTLRNIFKDKSAFYQDPLERIGLLPLETRRIQEMLLTINNSILDKAPPAIRNLITLRSSKYNLRHDYILSLPKVNTTKYGLKSWNYFATKKWNELANDIRIKAGTNEVNNKIRLLKFWPKSGFMVIVACFLLLLLNRFLAFTVFIWWIIVYF